MHRLLLRAVANNVALKFANWKDREAYPCTCTLLYGAWLGEAFQD